MNNTLIVLIVILVAAIYIYTFFLLRKGRRKTKKKQDTYQSQISYQKRINNPKETLENTNNRYNNYVTKYNSQEDYREVIPSKTDKIPEERP